MDAKDKGNCGKPLPWSRERGWGLRLEIIWGVEREGGRLWEAFPRKIDRAQRP